MFRTIKRAGVLLVIASLLVLASSSAALADTGWGDLPQSLLDKYGLTAAEVSAISQGFTDGAWRPDQMVTRAQFTKMAIEAFDIAKADPATPSFTDVTPGSMYYQYTESAKAAGVINGVTATAFAPNATLTHEQGHAIIVRWTAKATGIEPGPLGDAPAIAMGNLFIATTQALGDATIDPLGGTTRIQAAAALVRAARWLQSR
jgi:hypothetical protein